MDKHQTGLVYGKADLYESIKNHMERIEDYMKIKKIQDYTEVDLLLIALIEGGFINKL